MTDIGLSAPALRISLAAPADYWALLKPRVMSLVVFTAFVGLWIAPHRGSIVVDAVSILAIAVGAGASGALNQWWDADIDAIMTRTRNRPIPAGRIAPEEALSFGLTLAVGSVLVLGLTGGWLAAGLLAFTIFFYVVVYSMILKRRTVQNIVIGGAAGALPPVVAWAAATGSLAWAPIVLFAIVFVWTPPHFWSLALVRSDDYARAGVPMLPVVAGPDATRAHILAYAVLLLPVGLSPWILGFAGPAYALVAGLGGLAFVALAGLVYRRREGDAARRACRRLFGFSIVHLFALFATLAVERAAAML
ncbi:protoheme IX farnesyltransferase [Siculibacillus lacustris]|uniref:Protoheme IX farnesyltransferase n=1 Tax=Siculibacillus lacustris TaxID=1549641 RepID=A0A4Q9VJG2_9HYPH|nr:heme o synthase [Siculibacillus lacustris]TBW34973.1 protoheme IX farnesyltransferase [Siculibacillus lacustris]